MAQIVTPPSLRAACAALEDDDGAVALAGGTALQMLRRRGEFPFARLVDLRSVPGIAEIAPDGDGVRIGALVTHSRIERDPLVADVAPVLCDVASQIANVRVRNVATIGGNLAHRDHRLDPPGALMILAARLEIGSSTGTRSIDVAELFSGFADKTLRRGEVIVAIRVPRSPRTARLAFQKFKSLGANDWPCASVAARVDRDGVRPRRLSLGLTAVAPSPVHLAFDVDGCALDDVLSRADAAVAEAIAPVDDLRGGAAFKRRVARTIVADTVRRLWSAP